MRILSLSLEPNDQLVKSIPDDAFYYLVTARNFATLGRWTFDGVEPATGFHLLWGYLLSLLFKLDSALALNTIFIIASLVQVFAIAIASYFLSRVAGRLFGRGAGWGVAAVFLSASVLTQAGWLMESALVILITAVIVNHLGRQRLLSPASTIAGSFLLGWLLELARSDAGLLAVFLLLLQLALWRARAVDRSMPIAAFCLLAGAVFGVATILLHTHAISGNWLQGSAEQKLFWSSTSGKISFRYIIGTPLSVLQPLHNAVPHYSHNTRLLHISRLLGHILGFAVLFLAVTGALLSACRSSLLARGILLTLVIEVLSYCFLYQYDGAVQDWYVSNFVVAMALVTAAATAWYVRRVPRLTHAVVVFLSIAGIACSLVPTFPWQESMFRAGIYLHEHSLDEPQGAFNSGIIGFFAGHPIVNLDGLVNDSILPFSKSGRLGSYMAQRNIAYVFDSPVMFEDPRLQKRGGYADGRLLSCLTSSLDTFPTDPDNTWENRRIHLYHFDTACLKQAYPSNSPLVTWH